MSANECTNCTFGQCIQRAKEKYSEGFSYSISNECKLCTKDQLETLEREEGWGVYTRKGDLIQIGIFFGAFFCISCSGLIC